MLTVVYVGNDIVFEIDGLIDDVSAEYVNDATAEVALYAMDEDDAVAEAATTTATLSYVAASDGDYRGIVESSVGLTLGAKYLAIITASSSGRDARWDEIIQVTRRKMVG